MLTEKLKDFINGLTKVKPFTTKYHDMGLVVLDNPEANIQDLENELSKNEVKYESYDYKAGSEVSKLILQIKHSLTEGKFVLLNIDMAPNEALLEGLSTLNHAPNIYKGRLIVTAKRNLIENEIKFPYFYGLFGPILSI